MPVDRLAVELWHGVRFRSPLLNAAGMFKRGEGYELVSAQGAGGYLAGTTTASPRAGNRAQKVLHPFAPYPRSGAASNWLGLPNPGHEAVAHRLATLDRIPGCPVGASVAAVVAAGQDPDAAEEGLVSGLQVYEQAGVDFLELNESCPNTEEKASEEESAGEDASWDQLALRLANLRERFLDRRTRPLPVVVKLSCDTPIASVPRVIGLLVDHGFDGINLGNTSVRYDALRDAIDRREQSLYDHFTRTFGGGLSGRPLHGPMLDLVRAAREAVDRLRPSKPFAVIATGGIETAGGVAAAQAAGADLCQWYTGYFDAFGRYGHRLYERIYDALA